MTSDVQHNPAPKTTWVITDMHDKTRYSAEESLSGGYTSRPERSTVYWLTGPLGRLWCNRSEWGYTSAYIDGRGITTGPDGTVTSHSAGLPDDPDWPLFVEATKHLWYPTSGRAALR